MSHLPPDPGPGFAWNRAEDKEEEIEQVVEQEDRLDQAEGADVPRSRRLVDHLRSVFSGGASQEDSDEPEISTDEEWERERQRRSQYDQDRRDGKG
jgi:hypothetical protein